MTDPLQLAVAFVVGVLGVARAVRLITSDTWPPMQRVRDWWITRTACDDGPSWMPLLTCPFCAAPYVAALAVAAAVWAGIWSPDLGTLAGWWWVLAVWASGAYLAGMVVVRDEPPPVDA